MVIHAGLECGILGEQGQRCSACKPRPMGGWAIGLAQRFYRLLEALLSALGAVD